MGAITDKVDDAGNWISGFQGTTRFFIAVHGGADDDVVRSMGDPVLKRYSFDEFGEFI